MDAQESARSTTKKRRLNRKMCASNDGEEVASEGAIAEDLADERLASRSKDLAERKLNFGNAQVGTCSRGTIEGKHRLK